MEAQAGDESDVGIGRKLGVSAVLYCTGSHFLERESLGLKSNETNHKCENVEHLKLNIYRKCNMFQVRSFYTDLSRNIKSKLKMQYSSDN